MSWYLCTISATSKKNWELCKISGTWGISSGPGFASRDRARSGDNLLFWLGSVGYVGTAVVSENSRPPLTDEEVPWFGGRDRFGLIIPFIELLEFHPPRKIGFTGRVQKGTSLDQSVFQRGFMPINDSAANFVIKSG